jgi:hypothetical protein
MIEVSNFLAEVCLFSREGEMVPRGLLREDIRPIPAHEKLGVNGMRLFQDPPISE